jgi:hypothetical protein
LREIGHVHAFLIEQNRRAWVENDFRISLYVLNDDRSVESIHRRLDRLGSLTCTPIPRSLNGWKVHIKNTATGDVMDATITNHGTGGTVEFAGEISQHTNTWYYSTLACWFIAITVPPLMLAGVIAFFMPRHLRKWVVGIAVIITIASMLTPDERRRPAFIKLSIAPSAAVLIAGIAAIWPRGRKRSLRYCRQCGYDLTGNVSGVCPECGTALPPKPQPDLDSMASKLEAIE